VSELDEVIDEFLVESHENLDRFDADLLALVTSEAPRGTARRTAGADPDRDCPPR